MALRLLFITPRIDEAHDELAFASLWAKAFADAGYDVQVICTHKGTNGLPFPVHSLGGENGVSRLGQFFRFQKLITTLSYDRVFVHMTTRWLGAGAWWWRLKKIPTYLWFTHYTRTLSLRIGEWAVKRMFTATAECLPQYEGDPRKIVTGHGIDTAFWDVPALAETEREPATHLLAVHRLSRSKRFDLLLKTLALLPPEYHLTHYGRPMDPRFDPEYVDEIQSLIRSLHLENRVTFKGSVPTKDLRFVYPRFRAFINLVPRTIDKTVLEAMYAGLTPIVTRGQADAIGFPDAPREETPEAIAEFVRHQALWPREKLRQIVEERHSLRSLVQKMNRYMEPGI